MAIIQDWKIRATTAQCEVTGEPFTDEQAFFTCIFEDNETGAFTRRDYSEESWNQVKAEVEQAAFSFWKSTYKAPAPETEEKAIEDTSAEGLLRRFIEEDSPATENARYILALMLERKKSLVPTDSQETESRRLLFYEHAETGDVFIVADPGLKLDEIDSVQKEVSELLAIEEGKANAKSGELVEQSSEEVDEQKCAEAEEDSDEPSESE